MEKYYIPVGKIKLVATDLDGTLLDSAKRVPEDFITWVLEHGNIVTVLASGRPYYNLNKLFPELSGRLSYICENGGLIVDGGGRVLFKDHLSREELDSCLDRLLTIRNAAGAARSDMLPVLCCADCAYMEDVPGRGMETARFFYPELNPVEDFSKLPEGIEVVKVAVHFPGDDAEGYLGRFTDFPGKLECVISGTAWIDIAHGGISKGGAMRIMQEELGIEFGECLAFGDYLNDSDMLQAVAGGYAMENAHPMVKEAAPYVTASNDDDGVMKILRMVSADGSCAEIQG